MGCMFRFALATLLAASPALAFAELPAFTFDVPDEPYEVFTAGFTHWWFESEDLIKLRIIQSVHNVGEFDNFDTLQCYQKANMNYRCFVSRMKHADYNHL